MASRIGARNLCRYLTTNGKPLGKEQHAAENACFKGTEAGAKAEPAAGSGVAGAGVESRDSESITKAEPAAGSEYGYSANEPESPRVIAGLLAFNVALGCYIFSDYED